MVALSPGPLISSKASLISHDIRQAGTPLPLHSSFNSHHPIDCLLIDSTDIMSSQSQQYFSRGPWGAPGPVSPSTMAPSCEFWVKLTPVQVSGLSSAPPERGYPTLLPFGYQYADGIHQSHSNGGQPSDTSRDVAGSLQPPPESGRKRVSVACGYCRRCKIKCDDDSEGCASCRTRSFTCDRLRIGAQKMDFQVEGSNPEVGSRHRSRCSTTDTQQVGTAGRDIEPQNQSERYRAWHTNNRTESHGRSPNAYSETVRQMIPVSDRLYDSSNDQHREFTHVQSIAENSFAPSGRYRNNAPCHGNLPPISGTGYPQPRPWGPYDQSQAPSVYDPRLFMNNP